MLNKKGNLILGGRAVWPALTEPDEFKGKKNWKTGVSMSGEKAAPIIEFLKSFFEDGYQAICSEKNKKSVRKYEGMPWSDETDRDGELTGNILFNCKAPAETKDGSPRTRPGLFDASGCAMAEVIGGGSTIKVAVEPYVWFNDALGAGLRLTLRGVQVIELRQGGSGPSTSESCGFGVEEGFVTTAAALSVEEPVKEDMANSGDF